MNDRVEPVEFILRKNITSQDSVTNILVNEARELPHLDFKRIAVCASGPSLADYIEDIRARQKAGWHVAAMNGSYNFLQDHGIVADVMFMVDARPAINLPFVSRPDERTTFIIASQCDPAIFEALSHIRFDVRIWSMFHDDAGLKAIQTTRKNNQVASFVGALNVGQSCLVPIWAMGYKTWHLFGYDGSMRDDAKHAFDQPQNADEPFQEFFWPMSAEGAPIDGVTKRYLATPTMAHGAQCFPERVNYFRKLGIDIELIGEGLLPDMVRGLSSLDGAVTAPAAEEVVTNVPAARPRKRPVERLQVVTFKWAGHIPYFAQDVNVWGSMVGRHLKMPHELVLITDDGAGVDGAIRQIPIWRDHFEHGKDWHRVKLFAEEMADTIGPRFVCMDLDTVICGALDPLFDNDHPFMAWSDPSRDQYCTALTMMDAGAFPHVWTEFDAAKALRLRQAGVFGGYDQAWISHVLPGQPRWTREDGVLSFRADVLLGTPLFGRDIAIDHRHAPPAGARVINFHGKYNPRDPDVQAAFPWIADHWRADPLVSRQALDEQAKYTRMWSHPGYRKTSPGEAVVGHFLAVSGADADTDRIVDLGCGTGRAAQALANLCFDVIAVDFVGNAFQCDGGLIPFVQANLWSLPHTVRGAWGYCADVMEHLPSERVDQALRGIAARMDKGAFFSICFEPDESGHVIGEVLHLTVRPRAWWEAKLSGHFVQVVCTKDNGRDALFLCRNAI